MQPLTLLLLLLWIAILLLLLLLGPTDRPLFAVLSVYIKRETFFQEMNAAAEAEADDEKIVERFETC